MQINKNQLRECFGEIVKNDYKPKFGEHVFTIYLAGILPIKIKSKYTQERFIRLINN